MSDKNFINEKFDAKKRLEEIRNRTTKEEEIQMPTEIVQLKRCTCTRCGHTWLPRSFEIPITCPSCRSAYWNKPRLRENIKNEENQ